MKYKIIAFLCVIFVFQALSCDYGTDNYLYKENDVNNRIAPIKTLDNFINPSELPDKYRILVLTDTHFGSRSKKTEIVPFLKWLDNLKEKDINDFPKFCLILGDNVDHGYENEYKDFKNLVDEIEKRGVKVASVLGNHDLFNSGWEYYKKYCYPYCSLFKFETKNISWYSIDTGTGTVGIKQFDMLKEAFSKDNKPKIIMSHYPLANTRRQGALSLHDSTERNMLIGLFAENNVKAALCGHLHYDCSANLVAFREFGNPSFCYRPEGWTVYEIDETDKYNPKITQLLG